MSRDPVPDATLVSSFALTVDQVAINARLKLELGEWKGIKTEIEQTLAIPISDSSREEIAKKALSVVGMWEQTAKAEESKRRQLVSVYILSGISFKSLNAGSLQVYIDWSPGWWGGKRQKAVKWSNTQKCVQMSKCPVAKTCMSRLESLARQSSDEPRRLLTGAASGFNGYGMEQTGQMGG